MKELGVATQPTTMGFSVHCDRTGLEYSGEGLLGLFAQPTNILRPAFLSMLRDVVRFYREAPAVLEHTDAKTTLGELLEGGGYGRPFLEWHILPMGAAIWSSTPEQIRDFPARTFVQFFQNHGLLQLTARPPWRTIRGGSRQYVRALTAPFERSIQRGAKITRIERCEDGVRVHADDATRGPVEHGPFDHVIVAAHSDDALALLARPSDAERRILGAIRYQDNEAVLHTDRRFLPKRRRAWASWNYHIPEAPGERVALTYHMNTLQSLDAPEELCVTLNRQGDIAPERVLRRVAYRHPIFDREALAAQARRSDISGVDRVHYCGAYWRYGFHEDGVESAHWVLEDLANLGVPVG